MNYNFFGFPFNCGLLLHLISLTSMAHVSLMHFSFNWKLFMSQSRLEILN